MLSEVVIMTSDFWPPVCCLLSSGEHTCSYVHFESGRGLDCWNST